MHHPGLSGQPEKDISAPVGALFSQGEAAGVLCDFEPCYQNVGKALHHLYFVLGNREEQKITDLLVSWLQNQTLRRPKQWHTAGIHEEHEIGRYVCSYLHVKSQEISYEDTEKYLFPFVSRVEGAITQNYHTTYAHRASSLSKLRDISTKLVQFLFNSTVAGIVPLAKKFLLRWGAWDGGKLGILHYKTILNGLRKAGILTSMEVATSPGGVCQRYGVGLFNVEDEFIHHDLVGKKLIQKFDTFNVEVLGNDVVVNGEEFAHFVSRYRDKIREYTRNPCFEVFKKGIPYKTSEFKYYLKGAAICKIRNIPVDRFISAQFYYYHDWKGSYPPITYVVKDSGSWSAVQRYDDYVDLFSINEEQDDSDNVFLNTRRSKRQPKGRYVANNSMYEESLKRVEEGGGSVRDYLFYAAHPSHPLLPISFLKSSKLWLSMLLGCAWGADVTTKFLDSEPGKEVFK